MAKKRNLHRLHKVIHRHQVRTSPIYAELAHAPEHIAEEFLNSVRNPLEQNYARERIEAARFDLALTRLDQLDPLPYEHRHEGCIGDGMRTPTPYEEEHDVFSPRSGYITNRESYDV